MSLLIDAPSIPYIPKLAMLTSDNEALVLQQIHYWLEIESKSDDSEIKKDHYHDGRWWIYNTFEQWQEQFPNWSISTIKRTFKSLEEKGLIYVGNFNKRGYDRTNWYSINYEKVKSLIETHSVKMTQCKVSFCTDAKYQNDTSNTIDYSENTSKDYVKCSMLHFDKVESISYPILDKQIRKACDDIGYPDSKDIIHIFHYFYEGYLKKFHSEHPKMRQEIINKVVENCIYGCDMIDGIDVEEYELLIDAYFQTDYKKTNYKITHFMTEGIRNNLVYKNCY